MNKYTVQWSAHTFFGGIYTGTREIHAENEKEAAERVRRRVKGKAFPDVPVRIKSVIREWKD